MWRIIRNWYQHGECFVEVNGRCYNTFSIQRGIRQRSLLSPMLSLLIMDPLLRSLETSDIDLSINNVYTGGYLHADNIRTITNSINFLQSQLRLVARFTTDNFLSLTPLKCEIIPFSQHCPIAMPECFISDTPVPIHDRAKCLSCVWKGDLSAMPMIEFNISKARRALFAYGSLGSFRVIYPPSHVTL